MFDQAVVNALATPPQCYIRALRPDQCVGAISSFRGCSNDFLCRELADGKRLIDGRIIIMALESPRLKEFRPPIGTAKNVTWRIIRSHIHEAVGNAAPADSKLFLASAIQNQCSLGRPPKLYRERVFRAAWELYARINCVRRLVSISRGKVVCVINAGTMGNPAMGQVNLRQLVEDAIAETPKRTSDIRIAHSASWASSYNQRVLW
jgi:hypothetical protein